MKKQLFSICLLAVLFVANAYSQESATQDYSMGYNDTWVTYTNTTTNVTTATDSIWYYTVLKESKMPLKYDIKVKVDSVSGTIRRTTITLKAKKWLSDDWTTITIVPWTTGRDTTKTFTEITTARQYRYWQIYIKSDLKAFIFKVPELSMKFYEQ
jgi:hypothetical protein